MCLIYYVGHLGRRVQARTTSTQTRRSVLKSAAYSMSSPTYSFETSRTRWCAIAVLRTRRIFGYLDAICNLDDGLAFESRSVSPLLIFAGPTIHAYTWNDVCAQVKPRRLPHSTTSMVTLTSIWVKSVRPPFQDHPVK